jgi:cytidylate kinase
MRALAQERGVTIEKLNKIAETERDIDEQIDARLRRLGKTGSEIVVDSRLAFHWIPDSFKVYLSISREKAAERIWNDTAEERLASSREVSSPEEAQKAVEERLLSERKRYKELYDVDPYDPSHFDLVVDTDETEPGDVADIVTEKYQQWLKD